MIYKKKISKNLIDKNNHLNIANYIKLVDESNYEMLENLKIKKIYFVAKKLILENKREILIGSNCKIKSFLIEINNYNIISRHEFYINNSLNIFAICYLFQVALSKANKKIIKLTRINKMNLNKNLKKNYLNPFNL